MLVKPGASGTEVRVNLYATAVRHNVYLAACRRRYLRTWDEEVLDVQTVMEEMKEFIPVLLLCQMGWCVLSMLKST